MFVLETVVLYANDEVATRLSKYHLRVRRIERPQWPRPRRRLCEAEEERIVFRIFVLVLIRTPRNTCVASRVMLSLLSLRSLTCLEQRNCYVTAVDIVIQFKSVVKQRVRNRAARSNGRFFAQHLAIVQ